MQRAAKGVSGARVLGDKDEATTHTIDKAVNCPIDVGIVPVKRFPDNILCGAPMSGTNEQRNRITPYKRLRRDKIPIVDGIDPINPMLLNTLRPQQK